MNAEREQLQGWTVELTSPDMRRAVLEKAFQYRGDVTLTLASGERVEGYLFDRRCQGPGLDECWVRLYLKDRDDRVSIAYAEIRRIEFSGRDTAEGKSFELWMQKCRERKARGEKKVSLEPEPLD
jgi:hypothetical protein